MVLCSGSFDGLHSGHVRYLRAARALVKDGEGLAVAIAPDSYLRTAKAREPYWTQQDRAQTVEALDCVNYTILHRADSVAQVIRDYRPRLFVKGPDWRDRLPEDVQAACQETYTAIAFVDTPGTHTSEARR
jgi:cytidyltransferase-like protein